MVFQQPKICFLRIKNATKNATIIPALLIVHPTMRKAGIMVAFFVAFLILNQRVHYSIDILGGWLMAFICYQVVQYAPPILNPQMAKLEAQQQEGI